MTDALKDGSASDVWVAAKADDELIVRLDFEAAMASATQATPIVGLPRNDFAAFARYRADGCIDRVRCSIEKEEVAKFQQAVATVVDVLIEEHLSRGLSFGDLEVASDIHTASVFQSRGFVELESNSIDFSSLGMGRPISTHRGALTLGIECFKVLLEKDDAPEVERCHRILETLRESEPTTGTGPDVLPKRDPWAGADRFKSQI